MFYLNFQNQLQLLLLLGFSSYIFVTSLSIRLKDPCLKAMGLSFVIPLILGSYSFFVGPHNINGASLYLDLSWFFLILMLTLISLVQKSNESMKFLYPVIFFLPIAAILMQGLLLRLNLRSFIGFFILFLAAIELIMMVLNLISKNNTRLMLHSGIFLLALNFALFISNSQNLLLITSLAAAGLYICSHYFYSYTYGVLKSEHSRFRQELEKINHSIHAEVVRRIHEIERSNRKLVEKSKTDSMTGLYLKSTILNLMENMIERSPNSRFSLLMFDIDHFKGINDNQGHQTGDKCIKTLSKLMQTCFRKEDIPGRYGGDEFIVILPGASAVRAYLTADRFRQTVQEKSDPSITISVGIATYPEDGNSVTSLISAVDKALYTSKENGRNRVTCYNMVDKN
ncbi:MAG: diguanylate cyclase [Clostridiaceae bacterium]|jgi:diguanylate cyclase (GGDEF)-like protein|nr:diguanylate cyclase [Clostridiaceae bacterium]